MIQHPGIMALLSASILTCVMLLYAAWCGGLILLKWDMESGSELQVVLERRTYLISTILGYGFLFQILSLFLYIFTADAIHSQFVGAMCAAGSLNVNPYGYQVLILKIANCLFAGIWLIINHVDSKGYDYPLIRPKYGLLILMAPLIYLETGLQFRYFSGLHADVITSCCGSLFSAAKGGVGGEMAALPPGPMEMVFFTAIIVTCGSGMGSWLKNWSGYIFSLASLATFVIAVAALISFISLYFYEMPTHHCPFCLLQKEYGHVGYVLYATLLGGGIAGLGVGALMPFRKRSSLSRIIPLVQQRLTFTGMFCYLLFTLIIVYRMVATPFRL
jgi:hypothetical protein